MKNYMKSHNLIAAFLLCFMAFGLEVSAQQETQYSQYMFNQLAYNPAYAGSRDALSATMIVRRQWLGFDGGPATGTFNIHTPSGNERHGFGFGFTHDRLGVTSENILALDYAYKIPIKAGFLSLGLSGGFLHHKVNFTEINPKDTDPVLPGQNAAAILPRVGAGLYYHTEKFYVGASAPNFLAGRYYGSGNQIAGQLASKQVMHSFGMIGAILPMGENVSFRPSAVVKYVPHAPISADFNATFFFAKVIGVGAGYRTNDALVFMLEYASLRKFRAGYAFDMTLSQLRGTNSGSHELMIGLDLGWGKSNFMTPRYF